MTSAHRSVGNVAHFARIDPFDEVVHIETVKHFARFEQICFAKICLLSRMVVGRQNMQRIRRVQINLDPLNSVDGIQQHFAVGFDEDFFEHRSEQSGIVHEQRLPQTLRIFTRKEAAKCSFVEHVDFAEHCVIRKLRTAHDQILRILDQSIP